MGNTTGKKISELTGKRMISSYQAESWIPIAQYNPKTSSYYNLAINLQSITDYCNSYSTYLMTNMNNNISRMIDDLELIQNDSEEIDYDKIINNSKSYIKELVDDNISYLSQKITNLISNINKPSKHNNSYIRGNSKKISELRGRENITYHQDHSWVPVAQYDSRTNSYHNIAMNVKSFTSYSINTIENKLGDVNNMINIAYADKDNLSYLINNSYIAQNIVTYSVAYGRDYFEWQIL